MSRSCLSPEIKQLIAERAKQYPADQPQSLLLPILLQLQEENEGWLSEALMNALADYLNFPRIVIYELATFYDLFELEPIGRHKISLCTNISCMLCGAEDIVAALTQRLGIGLGETTPDRQFTLREVECLAACGGAPACQINNRQYHENLTPQKMIAIIDQLAKK